MKKFLFIFSFLIILITLLVSIEYVTFELGYVDLTADKYFILIFTLIIAIPFLTLIFYIKDFVDYLRDDEFNISKIFSLLMLYVGVVTMNPLPIVWFIIMTIVDFAINGFEVSMSKDRVLKSVYNICLLISIGMISFLVCMFNIEPFLLNDGTKPFDPDTIAYTGIYVTFFVVVLRFISGYIYNYSFESVDKSRFYMSQIVNQLIIAFTYGLIYFFHNDVFLSVATAFLITLVIPLFAFQGRNLGMVIFNVYLDDEHLELNFFQSIIWRIAKIIMSVFPYFMTVFNYFISVIITFTILTFIEIPLYLDGFDVTSFRETITFDLILFYASVPLAIYLNLFDKDFNILKKYEDLEYVKLVKEVD